MRIEILREYNLEAKDIEEMAVFGATTFREDGLSTQWHGCTSSENPKLWEAGFRSALLTIGEIGRVYTIRETADIGAKGSLIALATCYPPGFESGDRPISKEYEDLLAGISEEQQCFKNEATRLQEDACVRAYPKGYQRANMHVMDFSVAEKYRGQGYGSALIEHIVADAEREGVQTFLEASKLDNVRFYQKRGFHLTGGFDMTHPKYGPLPRKYFLATGKEVSA